MTLDVEGIFAQQSISSGAYPSIVSMTVTEFNSNSTTHNVQMPATTTSGNLLLMFWTNDDSTETLTPPNGWDQQWAGTGTVVLSRCWRRVATGSEGGTTYNVATNGVEQAAAHVYQISGWSGNTADIDQAYGSGSSSGGVLTQPSLSPSFGSAKALWILSLHSSGDIRPTTPPNGFGNLVASGNLGTTGGQIATAYGNFETASLSPTDWVMQDNGTTYTFHRTTMAIKGT